MAVGEFVFYHYNPSFGAAAIFVILFTLSALWHLFKIIKFKTFYFIPFFIGCVFEVVGYVARGASAKQSPNWTTFPYAMQSLLLLLGPTLLAASIYMVLGRLIILLDADSYSLIRPSRLTKFFVLGDVLSFLAQSGGGGILSSAKTQEDMTRGEHIIVAGLVVQTLFFGFFIVVTFIFHRRISATPTARSLSILAPWHRFLFVLYAVSVFIMIRSIFRVAEYVGGSDGYLQSTEVFIYVFDASLMFIVAAIFGVFHPSDIISQSKGEILSLDTESRIDSYLMHSRAG